MHMRLDEKKRRQDEKKRDKMKQEDMRQGRQAI